jgi:hypothetical protein
MSPPVPSIDQDQPPAPSAPFAGTAAGLRPPLWSRPAADPATSHSASSQPNAPASHGGSSYGQPVKSREELISFYAHALQRAREALG